jgi:hypothetical protein
MTVAPAVLAAAAPTRIPICLGVLLVLLGFGSPPAACATE